MGKKNQLNPAGNSQFREKLLQHIIERRVGKARVRKDAMIATTFR